MAFFISMFHSMSMMLFGLHTAWMLRAYITALKNQTSKFWTIQNFFQTDSIFAGLIKCIHKLIHLFIKRRILVHLIQSCVLFYSMLTCRPLVFWASWFMFLVAAPWIASIDAFFYIFIAQTCFIP